MLAWTIRDYICFDLKQPENISLCVQTSIFLGFAFMIWLHLIWIRCWCANSTWPIITEYLHWTSFQSYSDRKKKRRFLTCSIFMSFSPMELIFIGWVGDIYNFCWVLRNFDFKPANEIFSKKKVNSQFLKKCIFGGMTSKIDFEQNWCYGCVLYYGFVLK